MNQTAQVVIVMSLVSVSLLLLMGITPLWIYTIIGVPLSIAVVIMVWNMTPFEQYEYDMDNETIDMFEELLFLYQTCDTEHKKYIIDGLHIALNYKELCGDDQSWLNISVMSSTLKREYSTIVKSFENGNITKAEDNISMVLFYGDILELDMYSSHDEYTLVNIKDS